MMNIEHIKRRQERNWLRDRCSARCRSRWWSMQKYSFAVPVELLWNRSMGFRKPLVYRIVL